MSSRFLFVEGYGTTEAAQNYAYSVRGLAPGHHVFRLKQIDFDGSFEYSPEVEVDVEVPQAFEFSALYPNLFNPETNFTLAVAQPQHVCIDVRDVLGRPVAMLQDGDLVPHKQYRFQFRSPTLPSGLYFIQVTGCTFTATRKAVLLK